MLENTAFMFDRSFMNDPISDILRLASAESVVSGGFTAGGDWAVRFPAPDRLKFFAAVRGELWLGLETEGTTATRVTAGDVLLLTAPERFTLGSDLSRTPIDAQAVFAEQSRPIVDAGGGDDVLMIGGHVRFDTAYAPMVTEALPPLIHIRGDTPDASPMRWIIDRMVDESTEDLPGGGLASAQLAHLLFIHVLRAHLAAGGAVRPGWLRLAVDPRLAPALRLMHTAPGKNWRLDQLAQASAMSRTIFAQRFRSAGGIAPLAYLAHWRMRLATRALRHGDATVASLARDLGYASESAFSHAFKRIVGVSPSHYAASQSYNGRVSHRR
ncbi:AraC family transcriptional regulator [Luteibacter jiangsuensis]|uniref:AraC family transcriptional regulator n=2 Tax=Luteibacter jiangsuensis TaxID=637577 RepID=A0ABX0Q571_9GAMM|nr:AraC family transcriptional regulator [Luteibacter jiangsuensis]